MRPDPDRFVIRIEDKLGNVSGYSVDGQSPLDALLNLAEMMRPSVERGSITLSRIQKLRERLRQEPFQLETADELEKRAMENSTKVEKEQTQKAYEKLRKDIIKSGKPFPDE